MSKARTNADNVAGDISAVTAGTGLSGGGTSGAITLTNDMATTINAAGDILYGTGNDAYTRLALGTANQYLKVNSGATAPEWTTLNAGGMTELANSSVSGLSTVTFSSISGSYKSLYIWGDALTTSTGPNVNLRVNGITTSTYYKSLWSNNNGYASTGTTSYEQIVQHQGTNPANLYLEIPDYANSTALKIIRNTSSGASNTGTAATVYNSLCYIYQGAITSITLLLDSGTWSGGTVYIYGVK